MCTIVLAHRFVPGHPLLVLANRDERLDRPAATWAHRRLGPAGASILAPLDEVGGGTWAGIAKTGRLFAAVTNRFAGRPPDRMRPSRGALVPLALEAADATAAADRVAGLDPAAQNPFHLLVADGEHACLVACDGQRSWRRDLGHGVHVITERSDGSEPQPRVAWLRERLAAQPGSSAADPRALLPLLAVHQIEPLEGTCVHLPELGYGTRSSFAADLPDRGRGVLLVADGPPCDTPYRDVSALLRED